MSTSKFLQWCELSTFAGFSRFELMRYKQRPNKCPEQPEAQVLVDCHGLPLCDVLARRSERLGHLLAEIDEGYDGELSFKPSLPD